MNCLDCPSHQVIPDPDPDDWFCRDDLAVVCKRVYMQPDPNSEYVADRQSFKPVTVSCRPYRARTESDTPDWCPIKKEGASHD
jgi:hypothetical protein